MEDGLTMTLEAKGQRDAHTHTHMHRKWEKAEKSKRERGEFPAGSMQPWRRESAVMCLF